MSYVITDPDMMAIAADDLQGIGADLAATNTAAAAPTTGVLAPAADSVSARAAALLDAHALQYQTVSAEAELFHNQFVQTLLIAKNAYAETEASNAVAMQSTSPGNNIALIMGGTGTPNPGPNYLTSVEQAYLAQSYPGYTLVSLQTPESFWPVTGSQPFAQSVQQGVAILNNAILTHAAAGDHVVVVGYSQSATIASIEMRYLDALPAALRPSSDALNFMLLADPNNPVGGILTHFIPGLGAFHFPTPPNSPYATSIFTLQYDAIADFPLHPLWLPSDLNALFGGLYLHPTVPYLSAAQVAAAIQHQIANVTFYFMPSAQLPLLDPLRMIPGLGNPLADVLQPFLRPIVDLGYAPGLLPALNPATIAGSLGPGLGHAIADPLIAGLPSLSMPALSNAV